MKIPKMKVRPVSQQSCASFGGINHSPVAPIGTWYDARNLCSDMSPTAVATRDSQTAASVDGNTPNRKIVAVCGGERIVLIDDLARLWCGGHYIDIPMIQGVKYDWLFTPDSGSGIQIVANGEDISRGHDFTGDTLGGGLEGIEAQDFTFVFDEDQAGWANPENTHWTISRNGGIASRCRSTFRIDYEGQQQTPWYTWTFLDYGFEFSTYIQIDGGTSVGLETASETAYNDENTKMIRMGANVIVIPGKTSNVGAMWVNAVKLASGAAMVAGTDYGYLNYKSFKSSSVDDPTTLTLCDVDGKAYNNATVSSTEPVDTTHEWLNTSASPPTLLKYDVVSTSWVVIPRTFVKISPVQLTDANGSSLKAGDTVHIQADYFPDFTPLQVEDILKDSYHQIEAIVEADNAIVIPGILINKTESTTARYYISRDFPKLDYYVECCNRLWGCRYDESESINEIYASKLGDASNWDSFQGLSTDSWRASRGRAAKFTGAAVLDDHPLFFREESVEKVFPSSSGAHQIQTVDLEGVEDGAADSLCVISDRLYYKSRKGVMCYTGTLPTLISEAFGDMVFRGGSGARHQRKYCLSTVLKAAGMPDSNVVLILDTENGDWHIDDYSQAWEGVAVTWQDDLYYVENGTIKTMKANHANYGRVYWWAETAPQAIRYYSSRAAKSLTEHKWVSYFRIRYRMLGNGTRQPNQLKLFISYNDGPWQLKRTINGATTALGTVEINLLPRRMDNFRIRLEGYGPVQIFDMAWRMEESEAGH